MVIYPTKDQAILNADWRATAIRRCGGCAVVVEESRAVTESEAISPMARRRPGSGALSDLREP